jgi:xylulokinase
MAEAVWLGVDVGSTATKATAFDADGSPLASGTEGYPVLRPAPDEAEQDAGAWLRAVDASVAAVADRLDLSGVRGIGVTSQVDTHVPVDDDFTPLLPALLWQDVRTAGRAARLNEALGEAGRTAGWGDPRPLDASNPVVRALWLAEHRADAWSRTRWLLLPKDLVTAWLTGTAGADPLGSFKVVGADARYVPGVAHAPGLAERLAPLSAPEAVLGTTSRAWHGIPAGTPVATGTMDAFGNVLGSGLRDPGDTMLVVGTSVIVGAVALPGGTGPGVVSFAPFRGRQVVAGPTQSGGDSLRWWAAATGHTIESVLEAAATAAPGAGGVVFAPHLLGERAPLWDDEVRAWFTGLSAGTAFPELCRAVVEGVAHSARELLDAVEAASGVPTGPVTLSGGGSRSPFWCQVLADVIGRPVQRSVERDTAVVGAATLAAAAVSGTDPFVQGRELATTDLELVPDPRSRAVHEGLHAVYRSTYTALGDVHRQLRALDQEAAP